MNLIKNPVTSEHSVSLRELALAVEGGKIVKYQFNRGGQSVSKSRSAKIAASFNKEAFGKISILRTSPDNFMSITGHHRLHGLFVGYQNGWIDKNVLDSHVSIGVLDDKEEALALYAAEGSGKGHTGRQKINNPDLGLGQIMSEISSSVKNKDLLKGQYLNALAYCIVNVCDPQNNKSDWHFMEYSDVSKNKKSGISKYLDLTPAALRAALPITKAQKELIVKSLVWVIDEVFAPFEIENGTIDAARDLLRQASFFGFLLWEKIKGSTFTKKKSNALVKNMKKNMSSLVNNTKLVKYKPEQAYKSLRKILD